MALRKPCTRCGKTHRPARAKRLVFAQKYPAILDAARTAREAGYSARCAPQTGYKLLHDDDVQCIIQEVLKAQSKRIAIKADAILTGLMNIASFDPSDLFNDNGTLKKLSNIAPEVRRVIAGLKFNKDGKLEEVKIPDKVRSFELLGKHKRLFADVQVHEGEITFKERVARGRRRAMKPTKEATDER